MIFLRVYFQVRLCGSAPATETSSAQFFLCVTLQFASLRDVARDVEVLGIEQVLLDRSRAKAAAHRRAMAMHVDALVDSDAQLKQRQGPRRSQLGTHRLIARTRGSSVVAFTGAPETFQAGLVSQWGVGASAPPRRKRHGHPDSEPSGLEAVKAPFVRSRLGDSESQAFVPEADGAAVAVASASAAAAADMRRLRVESLRVSATRSRLGLGPHGASASGHDSDGTAASVSKSTSESVIMIVE
jgi:hypothetical protein